MTPAQPGAAAWQAEGELPTPLPAGFIPGSLAEPRARLARMALGMV